MNNNLKQQIRAILLTLLIVAFFANAQSPQTASVSNSSYIDLIKKKEAVKIDCNCFRNYSCSFAAAWVCTNPETKTQSLQPIFPQPNSVKK